MGISNPSSGGGSPGGANTQVQFNDAGAFLGNAGFVYDKTNQLVTVTGAGAGNVIHGTTAVASGVNAGVAGTATGAATTNVGGLFNAENATNNIGVFIVTPAAAGANKYSMKSDSLAKFQIAGQTLHASGLATAPGVSFSVDAAAGFYYNGSNIVGACIGGACGTGFQSTSGYALAADFFIAFSQTSGDPTATKDVSMARAAAGEMRIASSSGSTTRDLNVRVYRSDYFLRCSTQFDKTTNTTLGAVTGLAPSISTSQTFIFRAVLLINASAAGGFKVTMDGSATFSGINWSATFYDFSAGIGTPAAAGGFATAKGTVFSLTVGPTVIMCVIEGCGVCNGTGTFGPQFAQNVSSGTSSVLINSTMTMVRTNN